MSGADAFEGNADNEEFDDVIGLLREGPIDLTDEQPSSSVWAGISAELGFAEGGQWKASDAATITSVSDQLPVENDTFSVVESSDDLIDLGATGEKNVISLADRRPAWGRPAAILTLAAAVVLLLAVPVVLALNSGDDSELIAAADLELLDGQTGTAVVADLVSVDGDLVMDVDVPTDVAEGEFLELWLLEVGDDGVEALESLGRVDGSGRYDVPDDVDLERFTVVDISVELDDGNDDHSGNSVVRGELA